jgi:hypothetical protein
MTVARSRGTLSLQAIRLCGTKEGELTEEENAARPAPRVGARHRGRQREERTPPYRLHARQAQHLHYTPQTQNLTTNTPVHAGHVNTTDRPRVLNQ